MANRYIPDVKVHHTSGCELCGRTDAHTHTQSDWDAHVAGDFAGGASYPPPPAADPYVSPKRTPATRTTGPAGATTMSMITNGRDLLLNAAQQLDNLAPAVSGPGDPEEIGQIQRAEQLAGEADQGAAQASAAETIEERIQLLHEAATLAEQAKALRQQAKEGLETRAANAAQNMEAAEQIQGQIRQAAEGTQTGDELVTAAAGIHNAIEEAKTSLLGAASASSKQTDECLGLIKQAQDHAAVAAGMCGKIRADIDQYAGVLS